MPIVSRTTVTTTRTTGFRSSTIPVWIIALVVILLVYLQDKGVRASYSTTYIIIALTCGLLLGWSIGSVLQQIFFIRTVEIIVNTILTVLAICSLIVAVSFLLERSDWSRYESYRLMIGTAVSLSIGLFIVLICFLIQSVVCIMMLSWAFYGNLVIVESR
uniref:Uncharacterized protein n=1 Tax=Wuchereria bancrofti TaxID=6293 RepID=A0A1I8EH57_WUCBA